MKTIRSFLFGTLLSLLFLTIRTDGAQIAESKSSSSKSTPGLEAAKTLSTITGVAISPLLGVSAVGAWEYFSADKDRKQKLHWYAEPVFWVPALLLVALVFLKDTAGTALPTAFKKPFDVAETVENKVSGFVAAGAFVPFIVSVMPSKAGDAQALLSAGQFAMIDGSGLLNLLLTPLALAIFAIVWLVSHSIHVLIIISPFTTVDAALKAFRASVLSLVTATAFINPYLGAFISLLVVIVAYMLAGWSFRLMTFGQVYLWDLFTFHSRRFVPRENGNRMFTSTAIQGAPIRSCGKLIHEAEGKRRFEYRPWLVLPKKSFELPKDELAVGRGLFMSEIVRVVDAETQPLFALPPRYRGHEQELARVYRISKVRDLGLLKGIKAGWAWLKGLFGFRNPTRIAVSASA
ncbi:MAG: hypothetical protein EXS31_09465 [Pedosphaera sp.]|nr:hypothetical protein [Pedosphaera sp.]